VFGFLRKSSTQKVGDFSCLAIGNSPMLRLS
jgi:hypothetical protein